MIINLKRMLILFSSILIFSCNSKLKTEKHHYNSGNLKQIEFYSLNNNIDSIESYYDNEKVVLYTKTIKKTDYDSMVFYYKNGNLFKTGNQTHEGLKFGNWIRYNQEGYKSDIREYFIVKDESIINRRFYFDNKGDTTWYGRKFNTYNQTEFKGDTTESRNSIMVLFDFYHRDTISLNEPFAASVRCNSPLLRKHNSEIMMLLAKEDANFNERFSNENEVKLDTFRNLKYDRDNINNFSGPDKQYVTVFGRWFKSPGTKLLRGYMLEYATFLDKKTKKLLEAERKIYFEKEIYVQDTLE